MSDLSIEQKNSLAKIDELFKKFEEVSNASNIDKDDFSELVILGKLNLNDDELKMMSERDFQRKNVFGQSTTINKKAF